MGTSADQLEERETVLPNREERISSEEEEPPERRGRISCLRKKHDSQPLSSRRKKSSSFCRKGSGKTLPRGSMRRGIWEEEGKA